ncbi:MAG: SDR family oxidoreductase [bacterium]|nr:SDR family oxidoreductase [bacterium]
MKKQSKIVLITGASSGIGKVCAEYLSKSGHIVYGTGRNPKAAEGYTMIPLDVTDDASVQTAINTVLEKEGALDVLVNNAGMGIAGAIEDTSVEEAQKQFDTNFFGVLRVSREVLPHMRNRRTGTIINISSLGGLLSAPFQGIYCATKFAIEGMSEALSYEVKPYGVNVVLVEPGDMQTGFTAGRIVTKESTEKSDYSGPFQKTLGFFERDETTGASPEQAAKLISKIISAKSPRLRYTVGMSSQRLAVILKKILPFRLFSAIIASHYELSSK